MIKALLLLLIIALFYWIFWVRKGTDEPFIKQTDASQKVVSCSYCRLHVPEVEAVQVAGRYYCCDEHRRLDAS